MRAHWNRNRALDWYPHYIVDYQRDTLHLTTLEHGAYRLLIDAYMLHGRPLPDNDAVLARIAGMTDEAWSGISATIRAFFMSSGTVLKHKRCEHELEEQTRLRHRWAENKREQRARKPLQSFDGVRADSPQMSSDKTRQDSNKKEARNGKEGNGVAAPSAISKDEMFARAIRSGVPLPNLTDHHVAGMVKAGLITKQEAQRCHYSIEGLC